MENDDYLKYLSDEDKEAIYKIRQEREQREKERQQEIEKALENKYFTGRVKNAWIDVRKDEKKNSFEKRHKDLSKAAHDYYGDNALPLKYGMVHVFGETLYRLDKLRIRKHDNIEKYTIRNRGLALLLAASMVLVGAHSCNNKKSENITPTSSIEEVDDSIVLTRYYTVQFNDTLSGISDETGININRIKRDNDITNANMIYINQTLELNYSIDPENLEYYTQSIEVAGLNIYSIAGLYNTNVDTLLNINKDAIEVSEDGTYQIISDNILVPNFITARELTELTNNNQK